MRKERYYVNEGTNEITKNPLVAFEWRLKGCTVEKRTTGFPYPVEIWNEKKVVTENPNRRYFCNTQTNEITTDDTKAQMWWINGSTVEYRIIGMAKPYEVWEAL